MASNPDPRCIYCKRPGVAFGREHVIPKAFGTFGPGTLVLTKEVCRDCNHRLGKDLDQILARDTFEGLIRAEKLRPRRDKVDRFKARRIVIRAPDELEFGDFRGTRLAVDWKTRKLRLLDQVMVKDNDGKLHSFTEDEIGAADERLFRDRPPGSIQIIGRPAGVRRLQELVISKGARSAQEPTAIEPPQVASEPKVPLETQGVLDNIVWRGIAKISFNYLAKIQGADYVLDEKFDRIRDFINGRGAGKALVRLSRRPILAYETPRFKTTDMHLVIFEREGLGLRGRVSLFNTFTYDVMLCSHLGLIYSIKSGHAFDAENEKVYKLTGVSRRPRLW